MVILVLCNILIIYIYCVITVVSIFTDNRFNVLILFG